MAREDKVVIEEVDGVERIRKEARPDFSVPPPRKQLPKDIQSVLDDEEKMWETISDGR
jgi:fission process protein 1